MFIAAYTPATSSSPTVIECSVPQGSVLALSSFCYTSPLYSCWLKIVDFVVITLQMTFSIIYGFCSPTPSSCTKLQSRISAECIDVASSWMRLHMLQLNNAKTEIIWLTTPFASVAKTASSSQLWPNHASPCGPWPWDGIHIDADVSMRSHVYDLRLKKVGSNSTPRSKHHDPVLLRYLLLSNRNLRKININTCTTALNHYRVQICGGLNVQLCQYLTDQKISWNKCILTFDLLAHFQQTVQTDSIYPIQMLI